MTRVEAEVMDPSDIGSMNSDAGALVAQGATLMRVENESMLAVAIQRPRNEQKVLAAALGELKLAPEEAKRAYYSIPYKEKQPDGSQKLVPVEGPSIKAAMTLARRWGNCSVTSRALSEDATGADIAGIFVDFETNFRVERPMRASRVMNKRGGGSWTLNAQQWLAALQAAASKASRNAVLNGLPAYLVATYIKNARLVAAGDPDSKADPKKVAGVLRAFERFKVTQAMLEKYVDEKLDDWMGDHLATLIGLGNAIADKQLAVAEAFDLESEPTQSAAPASATGVTADAIANGTATGADGPTPGATERPNPDVAHTDAEVAALKASGAIKTDREPGEDDDMVEDVKTFVANTTGAPTTAADCKHPGLVVPAGKSILCETCALPITGPWPPVADPKASKPRQSRLSE